MCSARGSVPVGSFTANAFGIHDMHGNVSEWVQDCLNQSYNGAPDNGLAWMTGFCSRWMLRGGSWCDEPRFVRSASRDDKSPSASRASVIGFRVVRTLNP